MSDDEKKAKPVKSTAKPAAPSMVLVDYLGSRKRGPVLGAEIRDGLEVKIYGEGERPHARECATLIISGSDIQVRPGLNVPDASAWASAVKHKVVAAMVEAGDILVDVEIPRRQADRCALASRTYCPTALAAIEKAEASRGGSPRADVTAAISRQKARIAKRTPAVILDALGLRGPGSVLESRPSHVMIPVSSRTTVAQ